jgi:hydrogenase nickel incorporation protein HypB
LDILAKNGRLAEENRIFFREKGILTLNMLSGPGSGKTTLIEKTLEKLGKRFPMAVIEGDQATSRDADRIRGKGIPAVQINTGQGCHLDAHQVGHASRELPLEPGSVLLIENIGNLVCPALFDLGESSKIVLFSVTEGEDKPLKYPQMFQEADLVLLTKTDLLPYLEFSRETAVNFIQAMNPDAAVLCLSSKTGEGLEEWISWIDSRRAEIGDIHTGSTT